MILRTMLAIEFAATASEPNWPKISEYMVTPTPQPILFISNGQVYFQ